MTDPLSDADEHAVQLMVGRIVGALRPLANVAEAIDEMPTQMKRPDNATIWQANADRRGPWDLTMAHAREARRALSNTAGKSATVREALRLAEEAMKKALELLISERWQGRVIDDLNEAITAVKNARATFHKEP